ncbi:MAG TPA: LacI family DNA-binding transcriptional regulator, partial [bacterium]|nr:LacI family DNA-binding transcriptional regulator [bacterium]
MRTRLNIRQVAKRAGVSPAVVSVIINKKENQNIFVSKATRERVLKVIRETGYIPRKSARDLITRRTNIIGIICHRLTPFFAELLTWLQRTAAECGLEVIPYLTNGQPELEEGYLRQSLDGRVDGLIALAETEGSRDRYCRYAGPPYHLNIVYYGSPLPGIPTFHYDEKEAGRLAFHHLYQAGYRRLGVFGGSASDKRNQSFIQAAAEAGVKLTWKPGRQWIGYLAEAARAAEELIEKNRPLPDGLFCYSDLVAIAFLSVAHKKGIRIPQDIALLSCDNTELAGYTHPPLSSIDVNFPLLAKTALENVCALIAGKKPARLHRHIPVRLVV